MDNEREGVFFFSIVLLVVYDQITLTALGEMFESAKSIMSWLSDCVKVIASENHDVRWTTPLGLPVVQPCRKLERHCVMTSLEALSVTRETEKISSSFLYDIFLSIFVTRAKEVYLVARRGPR